MTHTIIGEYPYPNKGVFLHKIGEQYFNVSRNQTREIPIGKATRILATFFRK